MSDPAEIKPVGGGVPALERALTVLESLAQSRKGYSVSELSRRLSLPKSSVHLIVRTLERRGYLLKDPASGRYRVSLKLMGLGRTALERIELREDARQALATLGQHTGLTVHLGVLERSEIVIIERIEPTSRVRVFTWVGRRMSPTSTAIGKALLAFLPEPVFQAQMPDRQISGRTERAIGTRAALERALEHVRTAGYAIDDEEDEVGVRCVGAPILNRAGHAVAALSVAGTTTQVPADRIPTLAKAVRVAAREIETHLQEAEAVG